MDVFSIGFLGLLGAGAAYKVVRAVMRAASPPWERLAPGLGLGFEEAGQPAHARLSGTRDGFEILVEGKAGEEGRPYTSVTARAGGLPAELLCGDVWRKAAAKLGDPSEPWKDADVETLLAGPEGLLVAVLDLDTRADTLERLKSAEEHLGAIVVVAGGTCDAHEALAPLIESAVRLARRAAHVPRGFVERLAGVVRRDRVELGAVVAFRLLLDRHLGDEAARALAREVSGPGCPPEVRLLAAQRLGQEGVPALADLASSGRSLASIAACEILALRGDAAAERALTRALQAPELWIVRWAAEALARVGTLTSVEPLLEVVQRAPLVGGGPLREAARQAIASIQGRQAGGERGTLSLAEGGDAEGAVSVAPDAGAVSAAEE